MLGKLSVLFGVALALSELWVSGSLPGALSREVEVLEGPLPWGFDEHGDLPV